MTLKVKEKISTWFSGFSPLNMLMLFIAGVAYPARPYSWGS